MGKFIDLTNQKFGQLTALERVGKDKNGSALWKCECDCGNEVIVKSDDLVQRHTQSCGCLRIIDLYGKRFGKLCVKELVGTNEKGAVWKCKCDCGEIAYVSSSGLLHGTKSCGCLVKENHLHTHNKSHTRLYRIWQDMKRRCYNINDEAYSYYGGRGISVCIDWIDDFQSFYDWSIRNGYADNLTIDRIDVNGNYEPSNCRWATQKEQMNNTRNNHLLTFNGKTQTIAQWSEELQINYSTIHGRLRRGCSVAQALSKEKLY